LRLERQVGLTWQWDFPLTWHQLGFKLTLVDQPGALCTTTILAPMPASGVPFQ